MRKKKLHVVVAYSNPLLLNSRYNLYKEFEQHMLDSGVHLTTVECSYGERDHVLKNRHIKHIAVRANTISWNKENLLNIGVSHLPDSAKYIGIFDADIFFRSTSWVQDALNALQLAPVIQPWSHCYDLGPNGEHIQVHTSFCHQFAHGFPVTKASGKSWKFEGGPYDYPHSGYAWCFRREALDALGGLFEVGGMGSGDHHMALCLAGQAHKSLPKGASKEYKEAVLLWQKRAMDDINTRIWFSPGTIEHRFHGRKHQRYYIDRWGMFVKHGFNPMTDLKRNSYGVLEFSGEKPELIREFMLYLMARNEDTNSLI